VFGRLHIKQTTKIGCPIFGPQLELLRNRRTHSDLASSISCTSFKLE